MRSRGSIVAILCASALCLPPPLFAEEGSAQLAVPHGEATEPGLAAPMDDLVGEDAPVITFGKAVDLKGADIDPVGPGSQALSLANLPTGRPLSGGRLTSGYGMRYHPTLGGYRFHAGVDLAAATGTPVAATREGRVTSAGWNGGYGVLVSIAHEGMVETRYAHLSAVAVRPGDRVSRGQIIGYVGSTGRSTGPHLHYETRVAGRAADPGRF